MILVLLDADLIVDSKFMRIIFLRLLIDEKKDEKIIRINSEAEHQSNVSAFCFISLSFFVLELITFQCSPGH